MITFSGNRAGMSDEEGAKNTIAGLNRVKKIARGQRRHNLPRTAEQQGGSQGLHVRPHGVGSASGASGEFAARKTALRHLSHADYGGRPGSTIQQNIQWLGHFHTGGVPGRHELDGTQEVQWDGVMRGIAAANFQGYVAHEFVPSRDPLTSLRQAVDLCDV